MSKSGSVTAVTAYDRAMGGVVVGEHDIGDTYTLTRYLFVVDPESRSRRRTVAVEGDRHRRRVTDEIVQVVVVAVRANSLARR